MHVLKVHIQRNTNGDGSLTFGLRWPLGINPVTGKPKWHRLRIFKTEPNPTVRRLAMWEAEAADRAYERERELNSVARDYLIPCRREIAATAYLMAKDGHLANSTLARQETTLARFNGYLDLNGGPYNVSGVGIHHVASYRDYLMEVGLAASSVNCQLQDLSAFFRWCIGESYAAVNPARAANRVETSPTRALLPIKSAPEFWALLDRLVEDRQRATVGLLACSGLRMGEARALTWDAWDCFNDTLIVGKDHTRPERTKRHARVVPLCPTSTEFLKTMQGLNTAGPFVLGSKGGERPISSQPGKWLAGFGMAPKHLRRWFRTALETVDARSYIIDDIMGHRTTRVRSAYTPAENLAASRPVLERFEAWLHDNRSIATE